MGGCCSSSRKHQLHGTPVYYYYRPSSEEDPSLASRNGVSAVHSSGLLSDLNLNMSIPDTYRSPPAPIPYDVVLGSGCLEKRSHMDCKRSKMHNSIELSSPSPKKSIVLAADEEDACPTCLEDYDSENPKLMTKCNHHFHLSCILEWMERSDTCPICDQEMIYETPCSD